MGRRFTSRAMIRPPIRLKDTTQTKYFQEFLKAAMTSLSLKARRKFWMSTNFRSGDIRFQSMVESQKAQSRGIRNRTRK